MGKICAISGHRLHTLGLPHDENGPALSALKAAMAAEIEHLINACDVTRFVFGGAVGVDIWAAEMVLERMKNNPALELELAVPFEGQTEKWNNKSLAPYRDRYDAILATGKVILQYEPDEDYNAKNSYQRRNQYLADKCDYLLAVWNGTNSGTSMTWKMAQEQNKCCIQINPRDYRELADTDATKK